MRIFLGLLDSATQASCPPVSLDAPRFREASGSGYFPHREPPAEPEHAIDNAVEQVGEKAADTTRERPPATAICCAADMLFGVELDDPGIRPPGGRAQRTGSGTRQQSSVWLTR